MVPTFAADPLHDVDLQPRMPPICQLRREKCLLGTSYIPGCAVSSKDTLRDCLESHLFGPVARLFRPREKKVQSDEQKGWNQWNVVD